jgi:hypothetical protein
MGLGMNCIFFLRYTHCWSTQGCWDVLKECDFCSCLLFQVVSSVRFLQVTFQLFPLFFIRINFNLFLTIINFKETKLTATTIMINDVINA